MKQLLFYIPGMALILTGCKSKLEQMYDVLENVCDCEKMEIEESEGTFTFNLYNCKETKPYNALLILNALRDNISDFCELKEYQNIVFITGKGHSAKRDENIFRHCLVSFQF